MEYLRRQFLLEPGEAMLLGRSTLRSAMRLTEFTQISGISSDDLILTPMCAMPLPVFFSDYGTTPEGKPRRRWAGTRPDFMWHPLMWLPNTITGRYEIADENGNVAAEDDDLWAARISLEVTASGLYDPASGTWVDILNTVGLDVTDEIDLARIQDWLDGEPDAVLDAIDLTDFMAVEEPEWGVQSALDMISDLRGGAWALISDELLAIADDAADPENHIGAEEQRTVIRSVCGLGESTLAEVGEMNDLGEDTGTQGLPHSQFFATTYAAMDNPSLSPLKIREILTEVCSRLYTIREAHWHHLDRLTRDPEEQLAGAGAPAL